MQKWLIFCGLLLLYLHPARCHDGQQYNKTVIVQIDSLYKCYGVIFDSTVDVSIIIESLKERFTPNIDEIVIAEMIFLKFYNETNRITPSSSPAKHIVDTKKEFKKYNRQYVGFIDIHGCQNIIINLFDYGKKRVIKREIGDNWKRSFVTMLSEHPPFTIITYRVNLKQKKLYVF